MESIVDGLILLKVGLCLSCKLEIRENKCMSKLVDSKCCSDSLYAVNKYIYHLRRSVERTTFVTRAYCSSRFIVISCS